MSGDLAIVASSLSYGYPFSGVESLRGVSLEARKGECILVTGASGCGKSTLLRALNGLIPNHFKGKLEGSLEIGEVGTVMQDPGEQILATTVEDEIALSLEWKRVPREEIRRRVDGALSRFGIAALARRSVFELSSGERQKLALAEVFASGARTLVMDEPTANLSPDATDDLARTIATLKGEGVTTVVVDHRLYWLKDVADRVLVLREGALAWQGTFAELGEREIAEYGLRAKTVAAEASLAEAGSVPDEEIAVSVDNLSFHYPRHAEKVFDDFSCRLARGRVTAVVGRNGAGKTTLARLLCGLLKPQSGTISVAGSKRLSDLRKRAAFVMQDTAIQLYMRTVEEELRFSGTGDIERWLKAFSLGHLRARHPQSLSGGERQRLVIACALMKNPELMILDEPTSGLDGRNMAVIADVLGEYAREGGTVLLITHDLELLGKMAAERLVLK